MNGAHRWHTVWRQAWTQYHRPHIHCTLVTRKMLCHQQGTVHRLCRSGKGIRSCTQTCRLVGSSQARHCGVDVAAHTKTCTITPEAACVLVTTWVNNSALKWAFTKSLAWAPYCWSQFLRPSPKSFIKDAPGKSCMHMSWLSSMNRQRNYKRADPLEDQQGRKRTSGQHGQNQSLDICARAWYASEVWQRSLWRVSYGRRHKFHFLWWLFQLDPQEMQWYP